MSKWRNDRKPKAKDGRYVLVWDRFSLRWWVSHWSEVECGEYWMKVKDYE